MTTITRRVACVSRVQKCQKLRATLYGLADHDFWDIDVMWATNSLSFTAASS